jgi:hypothetical protein
MTDTKEELKLYTNIYMIFCGNILLLSKKYK